MKKTKIEWCDHTWNPVTGCLGGCAYCYARTMVNRFCGRDAPRIGNLHREDQPVMSQGGHVLPYPFGFDPTYHRYRLDQVRHMKDWQPSNIFICSMADLFGDWIPTSWIMEIFDKLKKVDRHNYLFLTKNPDRYLDLAKDGRLPVNPNFWYGTTVTTGAERYFHSGFWAGLNTFLSIEPVLGDFVENHVGDMIFTNWVIVGAETGNRKDKVIPKKEWIEKIVEACDSFDIPVFMKDSLIPIVSEGNMRRDMPAQLLKRG